MQYYGDYLDNSLVYIPWSTNNKTGAAINPTVNGTIAIYKDGNLTQKATANGITDTRSHDGNVGSHLLAIDTANDTGDAGFWAIGSTYSVKLIAATIDTETVTTWLGTFSLENRNMRGTNQAATSATLDSAMGAGFISATDSMEAMRNRGDTAWKTGALDRRLLVDTTITGLVSQTVFNLSAGSSDDGAYDGCTIIVENATTSIRKSIGAIKSYVGLDKTVTMVTDPGVFLVADADRVYILADSAIANQVLDGELAGHVLAGTLAKAIGDIEADTNELQSVGTQLSAQGKLDVNAEVDNALDTLIPATPTAGSINDKINPLSYTGTDVKATLDSEQVVVSANNDKAGYTLTTADQDTIVNKVHDEPLAGHAAPGSAGKALSDIDANTDVATSTRATDAGVWANGTRTITSLGSALVAEIWDALTAGMVTAGSIGKKLAGLVLGTDSRVLVSVDENVKANVKAINGSATAAAKLAKSADLILDVTVVAGFTPTTTQFKTNLTSLQVNNYIGRVATFYVGTINEQSAKIEAWDAAGLITVGALTSAPAIGDTLLIH